MKDSRLEYRLTQCCPVCRSVENTIYRRLPKGDRGHVSNECFCRKCGTYYAFEENKEGRPVQT